MQQKLVTDTNTEKVIYFLKWLNINTLLQNKEEENFILTLYKLLLSIIKSKSEKRKKVNTSKYPSFFRVQSQHRYKHLWKHFIFHLRK